jgi:hypothetical protein
MGGARAGGAPPATTDLMKTLLSGPLSCPRARRSAPARRARASRRGGREAPLASFTGHGWARAGTQRRGCDRRCDRSRCPRESRADPSLTGAWPHVRAGMRAGRRSRQPRNRCHIGTRCMENHTETQAQTPRPVVRTGDIRGFERTYEAEEAPHSTDQARSRAGGTVAHARHYKLLKDANRAQPNADARPCTQGTSLAARVRTFRAPDGASRPGRRQHHARATAQPTISTNTAQEDPLCPAPHLAANAEVAARSG